MFNANKLQGEYVKEITCGHLVAVYVGNQYQLAIVVQAPGKDVTDKGVLFFPPVPWAHSLSNFPVFEWHNERVIDLGVPAEFVWSGELQVLSGSNFQIPEPGFLVVSKADGLCICGRMQTGGGGLLYWKVHDGAHCETRRFTGQEFVFVRQWTVGWRDIANKFQTLTTFPPPPPAK